MFRYVRSFFHRGIRILLVVVVLVLILSIFGRAITNNPSTPVYQTIENLKQQTVALDTDPSITSNPNKTAALKMFRTFSCSMLGATCPNGEDGFKASILGSFTVAAVYPLTHPPASGIVETYDTLAKVGVVPQTYAAEGIGFASLRGFRNIWLIFRNVAFAILVLVVVVIAFMMMFRMKIGAQTSMTIESALPRIVFTMLLITFSYAISGFLIDIMYVVMGLMISVLCGGTANTYCVTKDTFEAYALGGPLTIWQSFFPYVATSSSQFSAVNFLFGYILGAGNVTGISTMIALGDSILNILPLPIASFVYLLSYAAIIVVQNLFLSIGKDSGFLSMFNDWDAFTISFGALPQALQGTPMTITLTLLLLNIMPRLIMMVLIFLTIIGLFFRIYFIILFSYLRILLYIIFAPAYLILEAIPGQNAFSSWFKNLFGELMTFPIIAGLFVVGSLIVNNFAGPNKPPDYSAPVWNPPFLGGIDQSAFLMISGMGILFLIPDLTKRAKEMLGVKGTGLNFGLGMFFAGAGAGVAGTSMLAGRGLNMLKLLPGTLGETASKGVSGFFTSKLGPISQAFRSRTPGELPKLRGEDQYVDQRVQQRKDELMKEERQSKNLKADASVGYRRAMQIDRQARSEVESEIPAYRQRVLDEQQRQEEAIRDAAAAFRQMKNPTQQPPPSAPPSTPPPQSTTQVGGQTVNVAPSGIVSPLSSAKPKSPTPPGQSGSGPSTSGGTSSGSGGQGNA